MPQFDYNLWKWRALYRRRVFFFCVLQAVLLLTWLTVRRISHHNQSWAKNGDATTGYRKFYEDLPILFYISHALLLATVLFTKIGRSIVHESQGKRLCDWSAFSLVLALIFLLVPLDTIDDGMLNDSRDITFTSLSLFGVALFQHLGVSEPVLSLTTFCVGTLWIIFLSSVNLTAASVISICIVVVAFAVLSRMQEYEFHRTFDKQKDVLQGSSLSGLGLNNGGFERLQGMGFGGNMSVFVEDTVIALRAMEAAIALQEELLNRDDLLLECEFTALHLTNTDGDSGADICEEDPLVPTSAFGNNKEQEVVAWKLTPHAASLQVNKMLCQSLYQAVSNSEDHPRLLGSNFSFNKICNQLFALFEGVRGSSLTLYANETVSEVLISAPKSIFELIVFLLLHDAVNSEEKHIVCLSCETSAAHGWHVSIQSLMLERHRDNRFNGPGVLGNDSNASTVSGSSAEGVRKAKQSSGGNLLNIDTFNIGRNLQLNENVAKRNRPMERLAERLTMKYLKSSIQHSDPEFRAGVRVEQKIIPLTSDRCMLAPTHDSLTFARSQGGAVHSRPVPSIEQEQLLSNEEDVQPQQQQPQIRRSNQDFQQWLFVVQRSHDLEGMGEIKEKMKSLCVPFRVKALSELRDPQFSGAPLPFSVMLIDEAFLSKIKKDRDESKFKFLRGLHLKWVVVSDPKKLSSATDIKVLYGIDGDSVSAKASMAELFECIQMVTQKLPPRTTPDAQSAFDDHDDPDSLRYRSHSSHSLPSFGLPFRKAIRGVDRSEAEAVKRWLLLVRQFKAVASKLQSVDSVLLNGLDARMKDIENLRDVQDNLEGLFAVPAYSGPLADMTAHKKKAKYVMDTYQPLLARFKTKLESFDLAALQSLAAKCAVQSSTLGLLHLSAWFTTLQEIVSITMSIMDMKETVRGAADGTDKSISFSFTSAGKALTSRSQSHSKPVPATENVRHIDLLTVDDVSEHDRSQSFFDDGGDKVGELPKPLGVGLASVSAVPSSAHAPSHDAPSLSVSSPQFKVVDAGLRSIIGDMVRAIEVAVWDAAMDR